MKKREGKPLPYKDNARRSVLFVGASLRSPVAGRRGRRPLQGKRTPSRLACRGRPPGRPAPDGFRRAGRVVKQAAVLSALRRTRKAKRPLTALSFFSRSFFCKQKERMGNKKTFPPIGASRHCPGRDHRSLPALATNAPPAHLLNASHPPRGSKKISHQSVDWFEMTK